MTTSTSILFACEGGANLGRLGRDFALAQALKRDGHHVVLAVPNLRAAHGFMGPDEFSLVQAPVLFSPMRKTPSLNFSDMLLNRGFGDEGALDAAVQGWLALIETLQPSSIIYCNAPTALIAARIARIHVHLIGSAFEIPPATAVQPSFDTAQHSAKGRLAHVEAAVVERINEQFARHGHPKVQCVSDLYSGADVYLTTLPELDPFGPRDDITYVGPVFACPPLHEVDWRRPEADHVFAYLRPTVPECESILQALQALQAEAICMMPGCPADWIARFDRVRFFTQPLPLAFLLPRASLVVTSGVGLVTTSLLCAVPVLYVPQTTEQHLVGRTAMQTRAVQLANAAGTPTEFGGLLSNMLLCSELREHAMAFAVKHLKTKFEDNASSISSALTSPAQLQ